MNKVYLISEDTLKTYSLINDNTDGKYLTNALQLAQDVDLCNLLGTALYNKIISLVENGSITDSSNKDYKFLLDKYIQDYLIWQTMSTAQISINWKFSNSGTYQNQDDKKSAIEYANGKNLANQYEKYANAYATKMSDYLLSNISKYPEYCKCENYEHALDAPLCSIFLEDIPTNKCDYKYK